VKFLLDHDVPDEVAEVLKHLGHDVTLVREALSARAQDPEIFGYAQTQRRIIITCNRGHFLTLARATFAAVPPQPFHGLIVLIRRRTRQAECAHVMALLRRAGESGLSNNINVA
jgi:predicted nuclease of predicted toxin-antitoxin system